MRQILKPINSRGGLEEPVSSTSSSAHELRGECSPRKLRNQSCTPPLYDRQKENNGDDQQQQQQQPTLKMGTRTRQNSLKVAKMDGVTTSRPPSLPPSSANSFTPTSSSSFSSPSSSSSTSSITSTSTTTTSSVSEGLRSSSVIFSSSIFYFVFSALIAIKSFLYHRVFSPLFCHHLHHHHQHSTSTSTSTSTFSFFTLSSNLPVYLLSGLLSALVFLNSLGGDFVHDDLPAVLQNADVLGTTSLADLLTHDFWGRPMADTESHKSYRPLTTLTFR